MDAARHKGGHTMKTRQYLHEDLAQIQRYFPGARRVALRTPFDLTKHPVTLRIPDSNDHEHGHTFTSRHHRESENLVVQSAHGAIISILTSYLMTLDSVSRRRTRWIA